MRVVFRPNFQDDCGAGLTRRLGHRCDAIPGFSPELASGWGTKKMESQPGDPKCLGREASAALVISVRLPQPAPAADSVRASPGLYEKTTRGIRIYLATPRLRGLLALNLSVAAAVIVRGHLGRPNA